MSDSDDRTPKPGHPSSRKAPGPTPVPDRRNSGSVIDPATVRSASALPAGVAAGSRSGIGTGTGAGTGSASGNSARRRGIEAVRADIAPLPVPGERVGDFGLEEAIGAGGMGAVFRAVDIKLDRQVALKILPPDQAVDPEVVQRYYQEGRAAARLDHENVARVYSIGHDGRYHYIAFEYIEGTTIRQKVEAGGPLEVGDAINYTLQIANALVHSSSRDVVHRDIKPSNIIVTPQGRAKLVDMGLARRFERGQDTGLTQSGMTLGTFDYISPEQARDPRDVDVRGDLYSLGCTLFHMLSGRPPFPDGTVLQKLLQHQEEAPPEIRSLNPAVPDDLAAILVKLMAKDRDRRYQSAEQLVRDLLTVAGSLGLRSVNPEGLVWMAPAIRPAPAWVRQLVWGVPALAFLVIGAGMALWGDGSTPSGLATIEPVSPPLVARVPPASPAPKSAAPSKEVTPTPTLTPVAEPVAPAPREIVVDSGEDLLRAMADAPPRSTLVLADSGPYEIRPGGMLPLKRVDLTLRAGEGVRPMIRLARDLDGFRAGSSTALIDLLGGRLVVEGVEFQLEGEESLAAIRADDAELIVRRCSFRRPGGSPPKLRPAAIALKATTRPTPGSSGDRSGSLTVESSEFDGGQVAVAASGPVEVDLRECTFGPAPADRATVWAENNDPMAVPAEFRLAHLSIQAGPGPVFRFAGTAPRVTLSKSAIAPPTLASASPTLVALDAPERLEWRGSDNLYGRFAAYLVPLRAGSSRPPIRTFEAWADDPESPREWGSVAVEGQPWEERGPLDALATGPARPGRGFQLNLPRQASPRVGARQGPTGPLPTPIVAAASREAASLVAEAPIPPSSEAEPVPRRPRPPLEPARGREVASTASPANEPAPRRAIGSELPPGRPAREAEPDAPLVTGSDDPGPVPMPMPMPMPLDPERSPVAPASPPTTIAGPPRQVAAAPVAATADPAVIRDPEEFREALSRLGPGLRTLVVAADADWTLPACRVRGMSSWVIRAERGETRPRIRFRTDPNAIGGLADAWSAWMTVQAGGLLVEGIDLVLPAPPRSFLAEDEADAPASPPIARRRAAFAVAPGTADLTLVNCSVTIEGDATPSAVVALLAGEVGGEGRLRFTNCLFRVGGEVVDVAGGRRLDLEVDNAAIAAGGSFLKARGVAPGRVPEELKLVLRKVTARVLGGLVLLRSDAADPELPVAVVSARNAVLTTGDPEAPLLRVDGQGNLEDLRGSIRWEGRSVAYHKINFYRRDQSSQPGAVPTLYDREFWEFTLGPRDEAAIHGDLKFPIEWPATRRPWALRRDDLRLPPNSPAGGADLPSLPDPSVSR